MKDVAPGVRDGSVLSRVHSYQPRPSMRKNILFVALVFFASAISFTT